MRLDVLAGFDEDDGDRRRGVGEKPIALALGVEPRFELDAEEGHRTGRSGSQPALRAVADAEVSLQFLVLEQGSLGPGAV